MTKSDKKTSRQLFDQIIFYFNIQKKMWTDLQNLNNWFIGIGAAFSSLLLANINTFKDFSSITQLVFYGLAIWLVLPAFIALIGMKLMYHHHSSDLFKMEEGANLLSKSGDNEQTINSEDFDSFSANMAEGAKETERILKKVRSMLYIGLGLMLLGFLFFLISVII